MIRRPGFILGLLLLASASSVAQSGSLLAIAEFEQKDGWLPSGLLQASDGNFYGAMNAGPADDSESRYGTIFKVTPSGALTVLHAFCLPDSCSDSAYPVGPLIEGPDGYLYGVTSEGGNAADAGSTGCPLGYGCGTVFKVSLSGQFTTLYAFCANGSGDDCPDGYAPEGGLTLGADGKLYGTTTGTIFSISTGGALTTLALGSSPEAMVQATDGNFYGILSGTTETVFRLGPASQVSTIYAFPAEQFDGDNYPNASALVQGPDGRLYGTTQQLGLSNCDMEGCGNLFAISTSGQYASLYQFCSLANCTDGEYPGPVIFADAQNIVGTTRGNTVAAYGSIFDFSASGLSTLYAFKDSTDGSFPLGALTVGSNGDLYGATLYGGDASCSGYEDISGCGTAFRYDAATPFAAPVQLSLSSSQVQRGKPVTASLKVLNAFSLTMQQCYSFQNGTPLGKVPGTYNSSTKLYTFSGSFTPATAGIYNYAVTCGGVESGFATLTVGDTTQTKLTASSNPVTPPANDTLSTTVTRTTGAGTPAGSVKFTVGTTVLGTSKLNGAGVATLSASSSGVPAGTYPVTATYSGDANDVASTSSAVEVTVK